MSNLIASTSRWYHLGPVALLTVALAACGGGGANAPTPTDPLASFKEQKLDWKPCDPTLMGEGENSITTFGDRVTCTLMRAPLDYANPALGELQVALLKVSAEQPDRRMGAILVNPGGPGAAGLDFAFRYSEFFAQGNTADPTGKLIKDMSNRYDMIGFDPRGMGASSALTCSTSELFEIVNSLVFDRSPENIKKAQHNARLAAQACAKNPLTKHIHTDATARDMDLVRSLMGDDKLNFLGVSYGTWLGAWYASLFPERVGRMMLDSSMDVTGTYDDANLLTEMGRQRVLDEIILPYAARHGTRFNLDRDASQIRRAMLTLPVRLKKALAVDAINLNSSNDFDNNVLNITAAFGLNALLQKMPQPNKQDLHVAIETYTFTAGPDNLEAARKAHKFVELIFSEPVRTKVFVPSGGAVRNAVICNDMATAGDEQRWVDIGNDYATRYPLVGGSSTANQCLYWSAPVVTRPPLASATKAGPILMLQSQYDAQTPIEGAQRTLDALPDASMIVIENEYTHGLFPYNDPCVDTKVVDYFLNGTLPPRTSSCAGKPLPADAPAASERKAKAVLKTSPYTDPAKAAEAIRRIHKMTEEATRRNSF